MSRGRPVRSRWGARIKALHILADVEQQPTVKAALVYLYSVQQNPGKHGRTGACVLTASTVYRLGNSSGIDSLNDTLCQEAQTVLTASRDGHRFRG